MKLIHGTHIDASNAIAVIVLDCPHSTVPSDPRASLTCFCRHGLLQSCVHGWLKPLT